MAKRITLTPQASIVKVRKDLYHLQLHDLENPDVLLVLTLRGQLEELTPDAVLTLAKNQTSRRGVFYKQTTTIGNNIQTTTCCRLENKIVAKAVAIALELPFDEE